MRDFWIITSLMNSATSTCNYEIFTGVLVKNSNKNPKNSILPITHRGSPGEESAMGAPKQKWTSEEEEALRAGVDKHGAGKWRTIQKDPEFSHLLATRSNIDLKVYFSVHP